MRIIKYVQTCSACPAQWDAWDEDGDYWYFRFRFGYGSAECEAKGEYREFEHGNALSGVIELDEFLELAGLER